MKFKNSTWWGFLGAVVVVAIVGWYFLPHQLADGADSPKPTAEISLQSVGVMKIETGKAIFVPQRYTATVVARRKSSLSFQASERIEEILVDEGDAVTKDQLLAMQDNSVIQAQYDAALARAVQSQAVLKELEQGPRQETVKAARAEVARLKAQLAMADTTLGRQTRLRNTRASSPQEYDAARFDRDAVAAAMESAQQNLDELVAGTRSERLDAQRAAVKVAASLVAEAKTRLAQTQLLAPFDGRISRRFLHEGSLPDRGTPVLELVESSKLEIRFGVSPEVASEIEPGQKLQFTTDANQKATPGIVKQKQPTLDRATRTCQVIVSVPDAEKSQLIDGQTVRIEFAVEEKDVEGFWVPSEALQPQLRGLWSLLVIDGKANNAPAVTQRRDVETLATWGTWSRVRGTLEPTDLVIFEGASRVSAGQKVTATLREVTWPWQKEDQHIGAQHIGAQRVGEKHVEANR